MAEKPPSSGRLAYTLRNLEIKEALQNNLVESFLHLIPQQMGMGPGGARRKGETSGVYVAEWKRFKELVIWECLWVYDVNILVLVENSKTVAVRKKLKIAQTGKISNSRGSSRDFKSRLLRNRDDKTQ